MALVVLVVLVVLALHMGIYMGMESYSLVRGCGISWSVDVDCGRRPRPRPRRTCARNARHASRYCARRAVLLAGHVREWEASRCSGVRHKYLVLL